MTKNLKMEGDFIPGPGLAGERIIILKENKFRLDLRNKLFMVRVVRQ